MKSIKIIVQGKVQGVFFRDNAMKKAKQLLLNGYVKNLANGSVEIVAQGEKNKIDELIRFIKNGPGLAKIEKINVCEIEFDRLEEFKITY